MHGDIRYIKIVQDMKRQRESLLHFQKKKVFLLFNTRLAGRRSLDDVVLRLPFPSDSGVVL